MSTSSPLRRAACLAALLGLTCVFAPSPAWSGQPGTPGIFMAKHVSPGENIQIAVYCSTPAIHIQIFPDEALGNGFVIQSSEVPFGDVHQGAFFSLTVQNVPPGVHHISATCLFADPEDGPLGPIGYLPQTFGPVAFTVDAAGGGGGGGAGGGGTAPAPPPPPPGGGSATTTLNPNGSGSPFQFGSGFALSLADAVLANDAVFKSILLVYIPPASTVTTTTTVTTRPPLPTTAPTAPPTAAPTAPATSPSSTTTTTDPNAPCPPNCKP